MIQSMTGYAAKTRDLEFGSLSLELKSVNSRFLDIHFRVGDELRDGDRCQCVRQRSRPGAGCHRRHLDAVRRQPMGSDEREELIAVVGDVEYACDGHAARSVRIVHRCNPAWLSISSSSPPGSSRTRDSISSG